MLKIIFAFMLCLLANNAEAKVYGENFVMPRGGEYSVPQVFEEMKGKKKLKNIVVGGELASVCQKMGCWVSLKSPTEKSKTSSCDESSLSMKAQSEIRVMFKGHKFTVPKDMKGDVMAYGTVKKKKLSKYQVKHFLKDLGCSKEKIEAIKAPIYKYQMEATGIKAAAKG